MTRPQILTWIVSDRETGAVVLEFAAPADRRAAEQSAEAAGFPHDTHAVNAMQHVGDFRQSKPKRSAASYRAAYLRGKHA